MMMRNVIGKTCFCPFWQKLTSPWHAQIEKSTEWLPHDRPILFSILFTASVLHLCVCSRTSSPFLCTSMRFCFCIVIVCGFVSAFVHSSVEAAALMEFLEIAQLPVFNGVPPGPLPFSSSSKRHGDHICVFFGGRLGCPHPLVRPPVRIHFF